MPDSRKLGPDGVGWGGKVPGEASWPVAQCGDCLSAQALGHSSLGSCPCTWISKGCDRGAGFPSPLQDPCPVNFSKAPPPQTAFSPYSFPARKCSSNSFSVSAMSPVSLSHCAIPTTAASHLGEEGGGCAATLHPSAPCLSMLWTMMLQHGTLGAVKTLAGTLGAFKHSSLSTLCPPHAH